MGQSSMTPPGLSLKQYISNIEENYPLVQRADNLIHQAKLNLKAQRGQYDPFIKADYNNKYYDGNNYYSVLNSEVKQPLFTS
ncbi:MAG TPA: TolC family protein, partial [Bacteroidia bacterium]|nr:TolC family protein [Bacteroidia bacterium]